MNVVWLRSWVSLSNSRQSIMVRSEFTADQTNTPRTPPCFLQTVIRQLSSPAVNKLPSASARFFRSGPISPEYLLTTFSTLFHIVFFVFISTFVLFSCQQFGFCCCSDFPVRFMQAVEDVPAYYRFYPF